MTPEIMRWLAADGPISPVGGNVTTGGAIIIAMLSIIGPVLVALIQSNRRLTKRGVAASETAAVRSKPTGNGFAGRVEKALERIEQRQLITDSNVTDLRREFAAHINEGNDR